VYVNTLEKIPNMKLKRNLPVVFALMHADGRTEERTEILKIIFTAFHRLQ